ncbi:CHAD domain-containing protein [Paenibacillus sp. JX-17]|uniref:CHAD domain-containing protein n=1 Tax=Paenibacillus lacisoli TaxID=3064525 RepID=A0ABT9CCB3_9BACL|nr:CHAD domain-containing protein [Paenibacillus sp. JX-17]MDO7905622.1 CHAD domain-containing protein [Paenibacillus sp. JX-17]
MAHHTSREHNGGQAEELWRDGLQLLYQKFRKRSRRAVMEFDAEDIHQARVNSRKLITLLGLMGGEDTRPLIHNLKQAQKRLGRVRDADVMIEALKIRKKKAAQKGRKAEADVLKLAIDIHKKRRKKYRRKLSRQLPKLVGVQQKTEWKEWLKKEMPAHAAVLDVNVVMREQEVAFDQRKQDYRTAAKNHGADSEQAYRALHKLRIAAKGLRYTASAASFAIDQKFRNHEQKYKQVQEDLGHIHDKRVLLDSLRDLEPDGNKITPEAMDHLLQRIHRELTNELERNSIVGNGLRGKGTG